MVQKNRKNQQQYSAKQAVDKLRRLANCLESGKQCQLQVAGEEIVLPANTTLTITQERQGNWEEVNFQFKWEVEGFGKSLVVNERSISYKAIKRYLGGGRKFRNVQSIRDFVLDSLKDGTCWTGKRQTPHFSYNDIEYYLNGDAIIEEDLDAIALPWGELKKRGLTEDNIKEFIRTENLALPDPKPKSKTKLGPGEDRGGYISIAIRNWKAMKVLFDRMGDSMP